jgi:aryl-alcohol dehydrogenase-like predicted oxidoreductase
VIGLALKDDPGIDDLAFVTTKASQTPFTESQIRKTCENSMRSLQMETIPLYQLHRYDTQTPIAEQMGALKSGVSMKTTVLIRTICIK